MTTTDADPRPEEVAGALQRWTDKANHRSAAEHLLIEHGFWLLRADFLAAAVHYAPDHDAAIILWDQARAFLEDGPRGSTSALAVLDFATALGEDRYRITTMGHSPRRMLSAAVHAAALAPEPHATDDTEPRSAAASPVAHQQRTRPTP